MKHATIIAVLLAFAVAIAYAAPVTVTIDSMTTTTHMSQRCLSREAAMARARQAILDLNDISLDNSFTSFCILNAAESIIAGEPSSCINAQRFSAALARAVSRCT